MVAGGQDIDFGIVEFAAEAFGQAAARCRVLGIDDDQIDRELTAQNRHVLFDGLTARPSNDVSTKQDVHAGPSGRWRAEWNRLGRRRATPPWPAVAGGRPCVEATTSTETAPKR